ncbi:MAG: sialate O-acetylesterase, partial [Planctomycetota bacterium]
VPADNKDHWPRIRDYQRRALARSNTGMVVSCDSLPPQNMELIGERLAHVLLNKHYDQEGPGGCGPLYRAHHVIGSEVTIIFDNVGNGLRIGRPDSDADTLAMFEIRAADGPWLPATAQVSGFDQVCVSHPDIATPVAARYAWADDITSANLYNRSGLPASPFTTE